MTVRHDNSDHMPRAAAIGLGGLAAGLLLAWALGYVCVRIFLS